MFDDNLYNLMMQITIEHKSLWRIQKMYKTDASKCPECLEFWKQFEKDKEDHIKRLKELLRKHL